MDNKNFFIPPKTKLSNMKNGIESWNNQ